jgi:hypothetical protein
MIGEEVGRGRRQHAARGRSSEAVWNLAPAHAACNSEKSNRPPKPVETVRLARRNAAIMSSPHPLRRTLAITLQRRGFRTAADDWARFLSLLL